MQESDLTPYERKQLADIAQEMLRMEMGEPSRFFENIDPLPPRAVCSEQPFEMPPPPRTMEQLLALRTVDKFDEVKVGQYFTPDNLPRLVAECMQTVHKRFPDRDEQEKEEVTIQVVKDSLKFYKISPQDLQLIQQVLVSMIKAMCQLLLDINEGKYDVQILQIKTVLVQLWKALKDYFGCA